MNSTPDFENLLEKYKLQIGLGLVGLILVGIGVLSTRRLAETPTVEILRQEEEQEGTIWVDLEGAVQKPGIYELPAKARVNDLLIRAGGLAAEADREWVSQNVNLAQKLVDSAKLFIPFKDAQPAVAGASASASVAELININTASTAQLDTLWGIGEKRAEAICANRPYQTIEELKTKAGIPTNVYERIKDQVTLY